MKIQLWIGGIVVACCAAGGIGLVASASPPTDSDPGVLESPVASAVVPSPTGGRYAYPVNERGQSFGPEIYARTPDEAPDLILAVGTNGDEGYVRQSDLRGLQPKSLDDVASINAQAAQGRDIPLYAENGTTVIGKFHIEAGSSR